MAPAAALGGVGPPGKLMERRGLGCQGEKGRPERRRTLCRQASARAGPRPQVTLMTGHEARPLLQTQGRLAPSYTRGRVSWDGADMNPPGHAGLELS
eukprot:5233352-Pyramimonas_sp.AAC.1